MTDNYVNENNGPHTLEKRFDKDERSSLLEQLLNRGVIKLSQVYTIAVLGFDWVDEDKYKVKLTGKYLTIEKERRFVLEIFQDNDKWRVIVDPYDPCYRLLYDRLSFGFNLPRDYFSDT